MSGELFFSLYFHGKFVPVYLDPSMNAFTKYFDRFTLKRSFFHLETSCFCLSFHGKIISVYLESFHKRFLEIFRSFYAQTELFSSRNELFLSLFSRKYCFGISGVLPQTLSRNISIVLRSNRAVFVLKFSPEFQLRHFQSEVTKVVILT